MPVQIITGQSTIAVFYRFVFPDATRFVVAAAPLDEATSSQVLGNVTQDYSLVIPILPRGMAWPFLRGFRPAVDYVTQMTGITGSPAQLLARLIPDLVTIPPADVLADIADQWYAETVLP
jgi:hypothetical protein